MVYLAQARPLVVPAVVLRFPAALQVAVVQAACRLLLALRITATEATLSLRRVPRRPLGLYREP
jgi:hypothetical protein